MGDIGRTLEWGTLEWGNNPFSLFRSSESRKSNASEWKFIQPDGPGCNSPVQRAKHTPFLPSEDGKNPGGSTEA